MKERVLDDLARRPPVTASVDGAPVLEDNAVEVYVLRLLGGGVGFFLIGHLGGRWRFLEQLEQ